MDEGQKIEAIKLYRERTGASLKESKDAVEAMHRGRAAPAPSGPQLDRAFEDEVIALLGRGQKIEAIKRYRERTGAGLKASKEAVEALAERRGIIVGSQGTGCFGVVVIVALCFLAGAFAQVAIGSKQESPMLNLSKIWIDQCNAARNIEDTFGTDKALNYLIGEEFLNHLEIAETRADYRAELPAFVAEIKTIFEPWQLAEYLETARQSGPFDPNIYADDDPETIEGERRFELERSAKDLLLIEKAKEWLLA
jgi:ribosomal protein L7/L12